MDEKEIQRRLRLACRDILQCSQRPSFRIPDLENQGYLAALHILMDCLELDDKFTIGAGADE